MLVNYTPFPGISYQHFDAKRRLNTTTILRGRFRFHPTATPGVWELRPDPEQGGLQTTDIYYNDDLTDAVRSESDFVPFKAKTDVIFNGNSYAPNQQPETRWQCGIKVDRDGETLLSKKLQVTGKREWQRQTALGWKITAPETTTKVALRASNAFGGTYEEDAPEKEEEKRWKISYSLNPAGNGYFHKKDKSKHYPAPQVEYRDNPITHTRGEYKLASLGCLQRQASPRKEKAGTYDKNWQENDFPFYPKDFDEGHFQCAPEDQQIEGYLQGNETITLAFLLPGEDVQSFVIPEFKVLYQYKRDGKEETEEEEAIDAKEPVLGKMNLDTFIIDTDSEDPDDWRVNITWRSRTPVIDEVTQVETMLIVPESLKAKPEGEAEETTQA